MLRFLAMVLAACALVSTTLQRSAFAEPPPIAAAAAAAQPAPASLPSPLSKPSTPQASPTKVAVGFYVMSVRSVDLKAQSLYADFYMWMRFTPVDEGQEKEILEKAEFMNGSLDSKEEVERKKVGAETYVCWRARGTFHFTADLHNYPFDTQTLGISVENSNLESDEMVFVDDAESYARSNASSALGGVKAELQVPEYHLKKVARVASESVYRSDFGDPTRKQAETKYSRFTLALSFERDFWPYVFKIVIPLIVILAMSYLVFFIPADEFGTASGIAITALLSCIAFNLSVAQNMPEIGYLVASDKFFMASYVLLFITLAQSVAQHMIDKNGNPERAEKMDRQARVVFPILCLAMFVYLIIGAINRAA